MPLKDTILAITKKLLQVVWENAVSFYHYLQEEKRMFALMDADFLSHNPENCIRQLAEKLPHVHYNESIVHWKKLLDSQDERQADKPARLTGQRNPAVWKQGVSHSSGLGKHTSSVNKKVALTDFPVALHDTLKAIQSIYDEMRRQPEALDSKQGISEGLSSHLHEISA